MNTTENTQVVVGNDNVVIGGNQLRNVQLEVGKYYRNDNCYIRVDYQFEIDEYMGVMVSFFKGHVSITQDTDLYYLNNEIGTIEITKEEFEAKLDKAQKKLAKLCTKIKNQ